MRNLKLLIKTEDRSIGIVVRLTLAAVILPHGCQLLLGWFGGNGFTSTMHYLTQVEGLPWLVGFLVILLQFFGALFILLGLASRLMAIAMIFLFIGMILTSHLEHGFFMNWLGNQQGEGFEYHLLVIGLAVALLLSGSGKLSLDRWLTRLAQL